MAESGGKQVGSYREVERGEGFEQERGSLEPEGRGLEFGEEEVEGEGKDERLGAGKSELGG